MSGTGQKGSSAPAYLTPMAPGQPIGETADGKAILPSFYFSQMIVRILAYLGQPVGSSSSGGGDTLTIGEQIAALQELITLLSSPTCPPLPWRGDLPRSKTSFLAFEYQCDVLPIPTRQRRRKRSRRGVCDQ